jgi:hypothetical protein
VSNCCYSSGPIWLGILPGARLVAAGQTVCLLAMVLSTSSAAGYQLVTHLPAVLHLEVKRGDHRGDLAIALLGSPEQAAACVQTLQGYEVRPLPVCRFEYRLGVWTDSPSRRLVAMACPKQAICT